MLGRTDAASRQRKERELLDRHCSPPTSFGHSYPHGPITPTFPTPPPLQKAGIPSDWLLLRSQTESARGKSSPTTYRKWKGSSRIRGRAPRYHRVAEKRYRLLSPKV